ncbi:MFS general substrate transporter [Fomitiporia mediterranea MF3/22]|uniref:MFS general substrate transporter n=1 Tax=Fomitiporia mediterranea (strain MF3/22) TaxID=694068 RepID=UPI0004409876|nr:MFS general substrate transporter [Fomitiporia mediterranea MF3/22]EJD08021.1 MFS general substrate transporter [Fomitiporia mediterranea MF3/22]
MDLQADSDKPKAERSFHEVYEIPANSSGPHSIDEKGSQNSVAIAIASSKERAIAERRLLRKLDMRFMPTIVLIYIMNYIDRSAITTARLKGLEHDLGLSDIQYDTAVAILYASYCTCQIPSNMVTRNPAGILICRVVLGIPEELAFRTSILFSGMMASSAFGSGAITITVGLLSIWSLPDFARLAEDAGEADEDLAEESMLQGLKMALKDIKVYIFAMMTMSMLLGLSFANFFPTYNTTITLLLAAYVIYLPTAPPWVWAAIVCCVNALHADRTGERFFHTCFSWWGVIIGYIIALSTFSVGGRYVALFLMASGHAGFALTLVWVSNTIPRPPAKRAAAIGLVNGIGNIGNLIGSYAWKAKWGPQYHQSMVIGIAALTFSSFLAFVMRCILKRMNKKLDEDELGALKGAQRQRIEDAARLEGITISEAMERKKGFRYLY